MSDYRFGFKFDLDPTAVRSLPDNHPAMMENRTLFPSTVVETNEAFSDRLLVSGKNNRKLGERIEKGRFKGYALYGLTLEERATCPSDCSVRGACYGNGMQMARRHRIDQDGLFFTLLEDEVRMILVDEQDGLLVRLHVLGDFPSVEYVAAWADLLADHPKLACYGYTHRRTKSWGGDEIGEAIQNLKDMYPDRFRIRWSGPTSRADGAVVIKTIPNRPRTEEGLVCPAQTDATACCATCGLCWEPSAKHDTIAFIKHGPKSGESAALEAMAAPTASQSAAGTARQERLARIAANAVPETPERKMLPAVIPPAKPRAEFVPTITVRPPSDCRRVAPIQISSAVKCKEVARELPEVRHVSPTDLLIEPKYQRDLSGNSIRLIKRMLFGWDWAKFKPPVCAETPQGLFVIDGQHTAIAAATHPGIFRIPVMVVLAEHVEQRADAFVSHNRDRLAMSVFQVFHAEVTAGNKEARDVLAATMRAGATIPRAQPDKFRAKPGDVIAVKEARSIFNADGADGLERVLRIAVAAKLSPIPRVAMRAIRIILKEPRFVNVKMKGEASISAAIASIQNIDLAARHAAAATEQPMDRACAVLIESAVLGEAFAA